MRRGCGALGPASLAWCLAGALAPSCARSGLEAPAGVDVAPPGPTSNSSGAGGASAAPGTGERSDVRSSPPERNGRGPAGPAAGDPVPPERSAAQCRLLQRTTVVSDDEDNFVVAVAADGERFGLLWLREGTPWQLFFRSFALDGAPLHDALELTQPPIRPQAALIAQRGAFVAAWRELMPDNLGTSLRVAVIADGEAASELSMVDGAAASDPTLAIGEDGGLVLAWTRSIADAEHERVVAVSYDGGASFSPVSSPLYAAAAHPLFASSTALPGAVAHAWVTRTPNTATSPERRALLYARTSAAGAVVSDPVKLVEHERYIYDTAIAVSAGRVAIATTDSRVNIGTVPLYLTLLEPDGTLIAEGIRLTDDHGHDSLDMVAGTRSFVIISDAFVGREAENRVFVRQFDLDGRPRFEPLQLTAAELPPGTRLHQEPRIVALGPDRYLALWGERAARDPRTVYDLIAGLVDCSAD